MNSDLAVHQLRLASGKRINSAADDPSGYVISGKMNGTLVALSAASDNVSSAQNIYNVAEGGCQTISDLMTQIKAQQAEFNNGGLGTDEQNAIATTISDLATEIDSTIAQTQFNGKSLINGSFVAGVTQNGCTLAVGKAGADNVVTSIDVSAAAPSTTYTLSDLGAGVMQLSRSSDNATAQVTMQASTVGGAQSLNFAWRQNQSDGNCSCYCHSLGIGFAHGRNHYHNGCRYDTGIPGWRYWRRLLDGTHYKR